MFNLAKAMTTLCFLTAGLGGISPLAYADEDEVRVHPEFELYARDAADICRADRLQLRIKLMNVYPEGIVKVDLYGDDEDKFLEKKGKLRKIRVPAEGPGQVICIDLDTPGTYAVASYHDLDADRDLDKKWNFKPKEPYALSTNPNITELRMPKFHEAAFTVGENGTEIELIYYGKKAGPYPGVDTDIED